jgi:hypothetical protein
MPVKIDGCRLVGQSSNVALLSPAEFRARGTLEFVKAR